MLNAVDRDCVSFDNALAMMTVNKCSVRRMGHGPGALGPSKCWVVSHSINFIVDSVGSKLTEARDKLFSETRSKVRFAIFFNKRILID